MTEGRFCTLLSVLRGSVQFGDAARVECRASRYRPAPHGSSVQTHRRTRAVTIQRQR